MAIVYDYFGGLYINLTNRCPNRCSFCIRNYTDSLGDADSLMLDREPSVEEVKAELKNWKVKDYDEVVFCGYGEPTERLEDLLQIAKHIKALYGVPIRINTNGLADLIFGEKTAHRLKNIIDSVSISLNEADEEAYLKLCEPVFGKGSYQGILDYIEDAKKYVPHVAVSVVGSAISRESVERCREIAKKLGVNFKVR